MGTRLYPNATDAPTLELLCGVPAGTAARLAEIEARHKTELEAAAAPWEQNDLGYRHWCEINNDRDLSELASFLLYGWGKFDPAGVAPDCAGSLTDPAKIARLFRANGITAAVALCGGVHWC